MDSSAKYLKSTQVAVFPSARRGQNSAYMDARLTTVAALARIINSLIDKDSFIIKDAQNNLEFNIYGYYFKVDRRALIDLVNSDVTISDIYACIQLENMSATNVPYTRYEILGTDVDSTLNDEVVTIYNGLQIYLLESKESIEDIMLDGMHSIHLLTKLNENWVVPEESIFKFEKSSLDFDVDCGEYKVK